MARRPLLDRLLDLVRGRTHGRGGSPSIRAGQAPSPRTGAGASSAGEDRRAASPSATRAEDGGGAYPGDFAGLPDFAYSPKPDGRPDPGEIVWTWVPYEEDHSRGKDRPVLLIGRDGAWLLALPLTSKDHDRDAAQEHRAGRDWVDIGSGSWDARGRPSEVRVNRIIRVDPEAVRREGSVLAQDKFEQVAAAVRAEHG